MLAINEACIAVPWHGPPSLSSIFLTAILSRLLDLNRDVLEVVIA